MSIREDLLNSSYGIGGSRPTTGLLYSNSWMLCVTSLVLFKPTTRIPSCFVCQAHLVISTTCKVFFGPIIDTMCNPYQISSWLAKERFEYPSGSLYGHRLCFAHEVHLDISATYKEPSGPIMNTMCKCSSIGYLHG
jgi:hypothetical protein